MRSNRPLTIAVAMPRDTLVSRLPLYVALFVGFALGLLALPIDKAWGAKKGGACGKASWYALDGRTTANGERMNSSRMTAAHKSLPFGTKVRVTNVYNKRSVVVRINDRGPFAKGRVIDVSRAAARKLGFRSRGVAKVNLKVMGGGKARRLCS